jgi:hypothetical protein
MTTATTAVSTQREPTLHLVVWSRSVGEKAPPGRSSAGPNLFRATRYLLANVAPRFHSDSDVPPEAGLGLRILS